MKNMQTFSRKYYILKEFKKYLDTADSCLVKTNSKENTINNKNNKYKKRIRKNGMIWTVKT